MAKCKICKFTTGSGKVFSCTVDSEERHHSFSGNPAVVFATGARYWMKHGEVHRVGMPAAKFKGGGQTWALNGVYHRLDGPAVIAKNHKLWYIDGIEYSEDDFNKKIKEKEGSKFSFFKKDRDNKLELLLIVIVVAIGIWKLP